MGGGSSNRGHAADLLFMTRPPLLVVSTTFYFAGVARCMSSPLEALRPSTLAALVPNLLLFVLISAASFVVNQIYDIESDRLNAKNFLLHMNRVTRREATVLHATLSLAALLLAFLQGPPVRELGMAGLALGILYSVPPARLKGRPVADMLANGAGFGFIGYLLGWLALRSFEPGAALGAVPYTIAMCGIFANTTIPDETGDRQAADVTTCVLLGPARVAVLALILLVASALTGFMLGEAPCALAAVVSLPAFIGVALKPHPAVSVIASQFAGRAFFVAVSVSVPPLALLGALTYGFSKMYYARRLRLDYPGMKGAREIGRKSLERGSSCTSMPPRDGS